MGGNFIACSVDLPFNLKLSKDDAAELEANIHNALELALKPYFMES